MVLSRKEAKDSDLLDYALVDQQPRRDSFFEENVNLWIAGLRADVSELKQNQESDFESAVCALIIGSVTDTAVGFFSVSIQATEDFDSEEKRLRVVEQFRQTWDKCTRAIEEFADLLPEECVASYEKLFQEKGHFSSSVTSDQSLEPEIIGSGSEKLYHRFFALVEDAPWFSWDEYNKVIEGLESNS